MADLFGVPLRPDPIVALAPFRSGMRVVPGPIHRVQLVIELVGPRTVPAFSGSMLRDLSWYSALGQPELYCMAPKDTEWQVLTDSRDGAYDSIALAWNLVSDQGSLTGASAGHLLALAERFGEQISRRAMAMPPPNDIDAYVRHLSALRNQLDAGYAAVLLPRHGSFPEKDIWVACANLGLEFDSSQGVFVWKDQDTGLALVTVSPESTDTFSLGNVQTAHTHSGLMLGFHIPTNPNPAQALEGLYRCVDVLSQRLYGNPVDEDGHPLSASSREAAKRNIAMAVDAMRRLGIEPGSRAALRLWGADAPN